MWVFFFTTSIFCGVATTNQKPLRLAAAKFKFRNKSDFRNQRSPIPALQHGGDGLRRGLHHNHPTMGFLFNLVDLRSKENECAKKSRSLSPQF